MKLYGSVLFRYTEAIQRGDTKTIAFIQSMRTEDPELDHLLSLVDVCLSRERAQYEEQKSFLRTFFQINPLSPIPLVNELEE